MAMIVKKRLEKKFKLIPLSSNKNISAAPTPENSSKGKKNITIKPVPSRFSSTRIYDVDSTKGRFGWTVLMTHNIPYIFRPDGKYCCFRMIDVQILHKGFFRYQDELLTCTNIKFSLVSTAEENLLNEINSVHCNFQFGKERFGADDSLLKLIDAIHLFQFLHSCSSKLEDTTELDLSNRCGFVKINGESLVPYSIMKKQKCLPLFYFDIECEDLIAHTVRMEGWELAYLKFCFKIQGIRNDLFNGSYCQVISLEHIKMFFPPNTTFEESWPSRISIQKKADLKRPTSLNQLYEISTKHTNVAKSKTKTNENRMMIQSKLINITNDPIAPNCTIVTDAPANLKFYLSNIYQMYKLQRVLIEDKLIYCINMKYNDITDKWVPVVDISNELFYGIPIETCEQVLDALGIEIYKANTAQMRILRCTGRYGVDDVLSMVHVNSVIKFLPQLKYMIRNILQKGLETIAMQKDLNSS